VVVDRLGFQLDADRREDGNFGPFHLDLGFKAPNGLGLLLDTSVLKGGGYLYADPANNEYAGAFELLLFGKFGIKAIGVLTTKPNDWSLLLLIFIQFPIPTPAPGFTVFGVGGLIGVQHGIDIAQLVAGMKRKAFDDILFPANPVGDAPRILNRLRTVFPLTPRAFTIGPMFDMGWGTPKRIVFIRVGLLIQMANVFGSAPVQFSQIVLIGQLRVEIDTKEDATITVVKLVVDILGFWDLDKTAASSLGSATRRCEDRISAASPCGASTVTSRSSCSQPVASIRVSGRSHRDQRRARSAGRGIQVGRFS
jgi:hypothetical protein